MLTTTVVELPRLWTSVADGVDGLDLAVSGELSSITAPALDSLLDTLVSGGERLGSIDLRHALVRPPAGDRLLARWHAAPGPVAGTYRFAADP